MAPGINPKGEITFYQRVKDNHPTIIKTVLLMGCIAACIYLSIQAAGERYLAGDSTWHSDYDYWEHAKKVDSSGHFIYDKHGEYIYEDKHIVRTVDLRFTTYTDAGTAYIAGATSAMMVAAFVILPSLVMDEIRKEEEKPLEGHEDNNVEDLTWQQALLRNSTRLLALSLLVGAFAGCVIMSIQADHSRHLEHFVTDKFDKGTYDDLCYSDAGKGYIAGAVLAPIGGLGAILFSLFAFGSNWEKRFYHHEITEEERNTVRGSNGERLLGTVSDIVNISSLGPAMRKGWFKKKEVRFLRKTCAEYGKLSRMITAMGVQPAPNALGPRATPAEKLLADRYKKLIDARARLTMEWNRKEEPLFSGQHVVDEMPDDGGA